MFRSNTHVWVLAILTVLTRQSDFILFVHAQDGFNFPDSASDPLPAYNGDTLPGLDGRQGTTLSTLPGFPTLPVSGTTALGATPAFPTLPATPVVNIVTTTGQTCICVPTGQCTPGVGTGDGIIDIRIVNNGVSGVTPVITNPPIASTAITTIPTTAASSATTSCSAGLSLCCLNGPYQCGVRYAPVAGAPLPAAVQAPYASYPWQAVLLSPGDVYVASGVLLNNLNVLTVAHRAAQFVNAPGTLKVRMGEWNAAAATEPIPAQEFIVSRIILHPNFNSANLKNDVAIIRLATAVPLGNSPAITTGCLTPTSFAGSRCFVSGWGRNDFTTGSFQIIQKQVDVPILQPAQCQSQLAATRLGSTFVFDSTSFICAGGEAGKDACTGDGSSPLVCQAGNQWFVAGLVAWSIGCGTTNVPGVYVNLASYGPWIQTAIAS